MITFERGARELELEARTHEFISAVVIPCETDPRLTSHGPSEELVRELRGKARAAGLLAPQVGGVGRLRSLAQGNCHCVSREWLLAPRAGGDELHGAG